eukprot:TRINITY_DN123026_c0_g1_i1.p1 TRINITY_DN123026_c0_g1~~TRINITY_DN123026_c0_g1_i1.p1  ORF type:complete len:331 (+),score=99.04 TRINITY_DN123026_c0_g1_i1:69-1061(+)
MVSASKEARTDSSSGAVVPVKPGYTNEQRLKLLRGAAGIYFFFIQYGKLQEKIFQFKSPAGQKFTYVWFLQVLDALANVIVGGIGMKLNGPSWGIPQDLMCASGTIQVMSKYCLSASLAAGLSFPVATLAKSAKMVPVMIGSLLLGGATFSARQIAQAAAIVGGTTIVTLAEAGGKKGKANSMAGLAFIALALACDGTVGGVQRRLKAKCRKENIKEKPYDLMFWNNLYSMLAAAVFSAARGEISQGLAYCKANPAILSQIVKFSICGALGQASVFYTIANFDSVVCTAVTTTRKLISVLISIFEGDKGLPPLGWVGIGVASVGICGEVI